MQELFIAKTGKNHKWLPLSQHLEDTAEVMRYLCNGGYITASVSAAAGLSPDEFTSLCVFCASVHDIGKATAAFQGKIYASVMAFDIRKSGFPIAWPDQRTEMSPHALAGAVILNQCFDVEESICEIIAGHHGRPRPSGRETKFSYQLKRFTSNFYGKKEESAYKAVWRDIYNKALAYAGIVKLPDIPLTVQAQMLITGLVIMADWIASNEEFFPLFEVQNTEPFADRMRIAKEKLHLPPAWIPKYARMDENLFQSRFGFMPNSIQKHAIRMAANLDDAGIMTIEAPMGMGKTEAALAAAELLSYTAGSGGIFFGLPTQGTANGVFQRMIEWAKIVSESMAASVNLAHEDAKSNTMFASLQANVEDEDGVQINAWMQGRHKALLPDFVTGTIDQALMAGLKKKFVMLLHLGLAGKTVIIDEIHSYDTYMSVFMNILLAWLGSYKVPVILLSATLTRKKRNELLSAYCRYEVNIPSNAYPLLCSANQNGISYTEIPANEVFGKTVQIQYAKEEELEDLIRGNLQDGGCVGVLIDTVNEAQKVWAKLKEAFLGWDVVLLHSRFLPDDRTELENRVLHLVGKHSKNRDKIIVVGTQVLEQSLDLDFDMMITDKCPMDFLFQRLGRLHRHDRKRPERLKTAQCFILNDSESCKRAAIPYDRYILRRTDEMLAGQRVLHIPGDIHKMTDPVYDLNLGSDGSDKEKYRERLREMERQAKAWCLPNPADDCEFRGMLDQSVDGTGNVRYGINNMDIILLKDVGGSLETYSEETLSRTEVPSPQQITEILHQKISVRYNNKIYQALEHKKNKFDVKWMHEPVFSDSIFAIMDERNEILIGNDTYSYAKDYGWRKKQ